MGSGEPGRKRYSGGVTEARGDRPKDSRYWPASWLPSGLVVGLWVNPGRPPTPIGGDGIEPFVDVPHWFLSSVRTMLRRHRIDHHVRAGLFQRDGSRDPDDHPDRIVFPGGDASSLQRMVDRLATEHGLPQRRRRRKR